MEPMKLQPAVKNYLWGGTRLREEYGIHAPLDKLAEAWMLSCHPQGEAIIENGQYQGLTLSQAVEQMGAACLGTHAQKFDYFPILIKLIDAKENLSVQVHPDDAYARRVEHGFGKTEAWYILDAQEGAELIYGFRKEISREEFQRRIVDNTLLEVVHRVPVKKGDLFFIEAGTLHAIGKGILLAEVQQNSNTTYRVYDYGRVDQNGKPRELHVDKAVDVTRCAPPAYSTKPQGEPQLLDGYTKTLLVSCDLFIVHVLDISSQAVLMADESSFVSVIALEGAGALTCCGQTLPFRKGESIFLPAGSGACRIEGVLTVLETHV